MEEYSVELWAFIYNHPILFIISIIITVIFVIAMRITMPIAHEIEDTIAKHISDKFLKRWKDLARQKEEEDFQKLKHDISMERDVVKQTESGEIIERQKELDALGLMQHNLEDIKTYYTWSQQQAKESFSFARIMSIAGFLMIVVSVVLISVFGKTLEIAIISAVGGVITELLAATVMIVYRNSMKQLNHYHQALHEDERFLSSINLIDKFINQKMRDEMLKKIIESEIEMNLAGINQKKSADEDNGLNSQSHSPENNQKRQENKVVANENAST